MNLDFSNVDQLCAKVDFRSPRPIIDLSKVRFFRPFSLVYLGMFLRYHNCCNKAFDIIPPESNAARGYLARQNFWERFNFNPDVIKGEKLIRFTTSTSLNDIIDVENRPNIADDIAVAVLKVLRNNRVHVKVGLLSELVSELVDNFALHSERTLAVVAMQYYPNLRRVVLAVGDCGIGIRASLSTNPAYAYLVSRPHCEVTLKAIEPLVSRIPGCGTGLTNIRDETLNLGGRFTLTTGNGYVIIGRQGTKYGNMSYDLPGVQAELSLPEED
ncbi:MAG: hypothetical protein FJ006_10350 [Chloroflexi bacterium]|nr:hypothetical protein [Chloroflexota bacterium]